MKILAIESSCDETAAAVVEDGRKIISSVVASQVEEHKLYGGVVPEIASRRHCESIVGVVDEGLSLATGIPVVPVHHLRSHIASNYLSHSELKPPFLCLVVSGGHSHIVMVEDYTKMRIIGKTRDDAAGEAFDKAARTMGMPYPGGIHLDKIAERGDERAFKLPHPVVRDAPYDFSFSGLKTAVINLIHNSQQRGEILPIEDLSASFRRAVVDSLTDNVFRAAAELNVGTIVTAGGVSANSLLRREMQKGCAKKGIRLFMPDKSLCGDNAAMVGSQGYYEYLSGNIADLSLNAYATMSIEKG